MSKKQQSQYAKYCSNAILHRRTPQEIYDYYLKKSAGGHPALPLPPRDPQWEPPVCMPALSYTAAPIGATAEAMTANDEATTREITPLNSFPAEMRASLIDQPSVLTQLQQSPPGEQPQSQFNEAQASSSPPADTENREGENREFQQDQSALWLATLNLNDPTSEDDGITAPQTPVFLANDGAVTRDASVIAATTTTHPNATLDASASLSSQSQTIGNHSSAPLPEPSLSHTSARTSLPDPATRSFSEPANVYTTEALDPAPSIHPLSPHQRRRRRDSAAVRAIPHQDVYRVIQTVSKFHCSCDAGRLHDADAQRDRFSLGELRRTQGIHRCFPGETERLPQPFADQQTSIPRTELDRVNFAQYLSTHPTENTPRRRLRLRSTVPLAIPLSRHFHVTLDVDSLWLRLRDLSDLSTPIEIVYTAHRPLNIRTDQHIPCFSTHGERDPELHQRAHSLFARTSFSVCTARIYVYWPHLKKHKKSVIEDEAFAVWIDQLVIPALRSLDSCATQDHPHSWQDAYRRSRHRGETQVSGAAGSAALVYTLSRRFITPLSLAMRQIIQQVDDTSALYAFRGFQFVVVTHDLKRAFNAEAPAPFEAFDDFYRALTSTFSAEFLASPQCRERSFADIGIEYNLRKSITEPTTLLIRRTCFEHRFSTELQQAAPPLTQGLSQPQVYTSYALHDAASGFVTPPARALLSAVMPEIKAYNLHKHVSTTHLRHEHASPFSLPHLDLLCLNDTLLQDIHKVMLGTFHRRTAAAFRETLMQTVQRLTASLQANQAGHNGLRIEPRLALGHLFEFHHARHWLDLFGAQDATSSTSHPFVFAISTADVNSFLLNTIDRLVAALEVQRFDLYGPVPAWNSILVRQRLGTTAVLLRILAHLFAGHERRHWKLGAARYTVKTRRRRRLTNISQPLDLSPAAVQLLPDNVRLGLMITDTIRQFGCYWLPQELFDFEPRVQLKPHLLHRVTLARPQLLWKSQINWAAAASDRQAYEGDAITALVTAAAQDLHFLPPLPSTRTAYCTYTILRMRAWQIWQPVLRLLARAFFRYIASLTESDPHFLPIPLDALGMPFHALTYDAVTRLLGEEPALATPRMTQQNEDSISWSSRLRYMFDADGVDQWQKNAAYLIQFRQWIQIFQAAGVHACYIDLWRKDIGYLMRPFVWIIPSYEKKTLFRLDKADAQAGVPKRLRTRWHLPGVTVRHRSRVMASTAAAASPRRFCIEPGQHQRVERLQLDQLQAYDSFAFAQRIIHQLTTATRPQWREIEDDIFDAVLNFEDLRISWFHEKINQHNHANGRWVPFWSCQHVYPSHEMQELADEIRKHEDHFAPASGFNAFVEAAISDNEDDVHDHDEDETNVQEEDTE